LKIEANLTLILLDFNMTIYSRSVESTKHPGTIRYLKYMKFLRENDLKSMFKTYLSESIIAYDISRELKLGPLIFYVAIKQLFPGVEMLSIYEDTDNKNQGVLATIASKDERAEAMIKEFMKITQVKEADVSLEELEKEVMKNIEFYKKL
jgi:hypothetical protein